MDGKMKAIVLLAMILWCGMTQAESVPLIRERGTFVVPVLINAKITLDFTVDSGASDVSIPADVFSTLVRAGTISQSDMLQSQIYVLADGSEQQARRFRIRTLRVGSLELSDVVASVAPMAGSLLLGQSFLGRLRSWSIDNQQHLLVMNEAPSQAWSPSVTAQRTQEPTAPTSSTTSTTPEVRQPSFDRSHNLEAKCIDAQYMCSEPNLSAGCNDSRGELAAANYFCSGVTVNNSTTSATPTVRQTYVNRFHNLEGKCIDAQYMCSDPHLSAGCDDSRNELAAANYFCSGVTRH